MGELESEPLTWSVKSKRKISPAQAEPLPHRTDIHWNQLANRMGHGGGHRVFGPQARNLTAYSSLFASDVPRLIHADR